MALCNHRLHKSTVKCTNNKALKEMSHNDIGHIPVHIQLSWINEIKQIGVKLSSTIHTKLNVNK